VIILLANIFQPLVDVFEWILLRFHDVLGSWGWSIIAMTVLVRACLLPLTFKQFKSMQSLATHAPEMKKLQDRYKNDKERLNQEMMKFYRENKINPFASCLPLAAQLPVFLSLFYMLRTDLRFDICPEVQTAHGAPPASPVPCGPGGDAQFFFIPDLTNKATGWVLAVLIVLYVGSQLFSTLLMSTTTDRTQRMIFLALPFLFVTFVVRFPAGLLVYWITTNLWTIVQQSIIRKRLGPMRPPGQEGMGLGELIRSAGGGGGTPATASSGASGRSNGGGSSGGRDGKAPEGRPTGPPPAPPRRKKKRSGRRR
jgi:YidC/Oxa1 family membrane protein insertase